MITFLDSTILVGALAEAEPNHIACVGLLNGLDVRIYAHSLTETFNTITGGRSGYRLSANDATRFLEESILPSVNVVSLTPREMLAAMRGSQARGVRGAAIFDFLHLIAARKAGAARLYTLNLRHFQSIHRPGDPEVVHPSFKQ